MRDVCIAAGMTAEQAAELCSNIEQVLVLDAAARVKHIVRAAIRHRCHHLGLPRRFDDEEHVNAMARAWSAAWPRRER